MDFNGVVNSFTGVSDAIPERYKLIATLLFFTVLIVFYSIFVFYFYKFLARKDVLNLNLKKHSEGMNGAILMFLSFLFYVIEFIIIMPIVSFFWFMCLAMLLMVLSEHNAGTILTIAAALVASVRIAAFINESLSKDIAKLIPFILLGSFIIEPNFFNISDFVERISFIPELIHDFPYYLLFIVFIDIFMRLFDILLRIFSSDGLEGNDEED